MPSRPGSTSHSARAPDGLVMATRNSGWHTLSSKSRASATHSPFTESHVNVLTLFSYRFDIAQWRQQTDPQHRARETRKLQPHRTREPRPSPEKKNSDMQQHNTGKPHERAGDWRLDSRVQRDPASNTAGTREKTMAGVPFGIAQICGDTTTMLDEEARQVQKANPDTADSTWDEWTLH